MAFLYGNSLEDTGHFLYFCTETIHKISDKLTFFIRYIPKMIWPPPLQKSILDPLSPSARLAFRYNLFDILLVTRQFYNTICSISRAKSSRQPAATRQFFAEFKPLNLPKLNKKFTEAKRKSRQKPPPNAQFCTVFGTSIFPPNVPKTARHPPRLGAPTTPADTPATQPRNPAPDPTTPRRVASRHPARGGPKPLAGRVPDTAPDTARHHARRPRADHPDAQKHPRPGPRTLAPRGVEPRPCRAWRDAPSRPPGDAAPLRETSETHKKTPRLTLLFARAFYIYLFFLLYILSFYVHYSKSCI